jgi:hypothetical protein
MNDFRASHSRQRRKMGCLGILLLALTCIVLFLLLPVVIPVRVRYCTSDSRSVRQTADGGYIVAGTYYYDAGPSYFEKTNPDADAWLVKIDSEGREEWNRRFKGEKKACGLGVEQTSDGGYILIGGGIGLIKTNAEGNREWQDSSVTSGGYLSPTEDGGYIILENRNKDVWLVKTGGDGSLQWKKSLLRSKWENGRISQGYARGIIRTADGGYLCAGITEPWTYEAWLVKTDADGNIQWEKSFDDEWSGVGPQVQQTTDGGHMIAVHEDGNILLMKTDGSGVEEWRKVLGDRAGEVWSLIQTSDLGYMIAGSKRSVVAGSTDVWIVKTDSDGNEQWNRAFGGMEHESARSVQQTRDGGYIIAGYTETYEYTGGEHRGWLVKTDADGNAEWKNVLGLSDRAEKILQFIWIFTSPLSRRVYPLQRA